jgi:hypothetical protein
VKYLLDISLNDSRSDSVDSKGSQHGLLQLSRETNPDSANPAVSPINWSMSTGAVIEIKVKSRCLQLLCYLLRTWPIRNSLLAGVFRAAVDQCDQSLMNQGQHLEGCLLIRRFARQDAIHDLDGSLVRHQRREGLIQMP